MLLWLLWGILWFVFAVIKFVLWIIGLFLFCLWWCQGELLYLPHVGDRTVDRRPQFNPPGHQSPNEHGMDFEDVYVTARDGVTIHLWFIKQPAVTSCPTVIFFHGNAGNIGLRLHNAKAMYDRLKVNLVLVDYRGYGNSTGAPSEKGLMLDAQAVLDWANSRQDCIDPHSIFIFGRSLGGAVALGLCYYNQDAIKGVIVENTFLSIDEMVLVLAAKLLEQANARLKYVPVVRRFLRFYLCSHWKSDFRASGIRVPILFISGLADELIPPTHSARLYKLSSPNCPLTTLFTVEGGTHNETYVQPPVANYYNAFRTFLAGALTFVAEGVSETEMQRLKSGA